MARERIDVIEKETRMTAAQNHFVCEVELQPGETLSLPPALLGQLSAGRWIITVEPADDRETVRNHDAFLNGYDADDEGMYDDHSSR